jgi:quinol monooxygenase YgiN
MCPPPQDAGSPVYLAVIRGTLALPDGGVPGDAGYSAEDLATLRDRHNAIAMGGEPTARDGGDLAHDVLLGTTLLSSAGGAKLDEFVALDRWTSSTAMRAFYSDPNVAAAFGSLFSGPPVIEFFEARPTWVNWGDMTSGDGFTPYWFHFALGTQSGSTDAARQAAHDGVACFGKMPSIAAGNVAHVVYTGLTDSTRFLAVDIWGSSANIEAFYTDPNFVQAFGQLFTSVGQPTYVSTSGAATASGRTGWYQW